MQFETKIVNGKPSIYFASGNFYIKSAFLFFKIINILIDSSKPSYTKKVNTKDKRATKAIRDSYDISGEVDHVKPSPRNISKNTNEVQTKLAANIKKNSNNNNSNNGLTLKPDQLLSLLSAIQSNGAQIKIGKKVYLKFFSKSF